MNCEYVHTWLMQVDSLLVKDWPRDMNRHFKACVACAKLARNLHRLEEAWRDLPLPEGCARAKADFLKTINNPTKPQLEESRKPAMTKPAGRPWHPVRWVAVAAMLLIGISAFGWMLFMPGQGSAAPSDLVDRLIEWNLDITKADPRERKRLREAHEVKLREDLKKDETRLSLEEREMAANLLEAGCKLAANEDDLLAEADIITGIAEKLADRASTAEASGNEKEKERCALHYDRFRQFGVVPMQKGLTPFFVKFSQIKLPEPKTDSGPDKSDKSPEKSMNQHKLNLEKIWSRLPERTRSDLHKRFESLSKKSSSMSRNGDRK